MMHRVEEVVDTVIKPKFGVHLFTDAPNGYWVITMQKDDESKTGVVMLHGDYAYFRWVKI